MGCANRWPWIAAAALALAASAGDLEQGLLAVKVVPAMAWLAMSGAYSAKFISEAGSQRSRSALFYRRAPDHPWGSARTFHVFQPLRPSQRN